MASLIPWRRDRDGGKSLTRSSDYPLTQLRNEFESLFERFFGRFPSVLAEDWGIQPAWGLDMDDTGKRSLCGPKRRDSIRAISTFA